MYVKSPKGFVESIWRRYFKQFFPWLEENYLNRDLYQTFELTALLISSSMPVKEAASLVQKEFRSFLKSNGFRKLDGKWIRRQSMFASEWWDALFKTGVPPKEPK